MDCAEIFRTRLRKAREELGWSQTELGNRCGLTPAAINHFESGRRLPSFMNLVKIARALHKRCDTSFLIGKA